MKADRAREKAESEDTGSKKPKARTCKAGAAVKEWKMVDEGEIPLCIPEEKPAKSLKRHRSIFRSRLIPARTAKPGKWKSRIFTGILGLAVLILIANSSRLINSWHRNFSTPEEYYRWVEGKAVQRKAKTFAEYYAHYVAEYLRRFDRHVSGEIRVELGASGRSLMRIANLEPWIKEGAFTFESTCRNSVVQGLLGLEIDGVKLLDIETILDLGDEAVYLGLPGLTDSYLAIDTEERRFTDRFEALSGMKPEEYLEYLELLEELYGECPDRSQMEALAGRYLELLLGSIDDVKMRTGKNVRVGNITQSCTVLEMYLDKDDMRDTLTVLLEELREDRELEALLYQLYGLVQEPGTRYYRNPDELYETFQDNIDELLDNMDYYITYHNEMEMTVYVDDKGRIIGRTIEFPNSRDEILLSYLKPCRGSRFGYKGSIQTNDMEVTITGSGTELGNKLNGSFTVKYDGYGAVDIGITNLNVRSLRKGFLNGSFTVMAASGAGRAEEADYGYVMLPGMKLDINVSMNRNSEKWNVELREGGMLWGSMTIASKYEDGRDIKVPSTKKAVFVDDEQDFEEWWDTIEWSGLIKKMDKAGMPPEIIENVKELSTMDVDKVMEKLKQLLFWM